MNNRRDVAFVFTISVVIYLNVANAPFLHDDNMAVLKNPDVQGTSSLTKIWLNDFWGTPMNCSTSHKSYRPITICLFRLVHSLFGNWSPPYHLINIFLHATVASMFLVVARQLIFTDELENEALVASLLFALHPIHTEAVSGVVGMAELLSALFFMLALYMAKGAYDSKYNNIGLITETKISLSLDQKRDPGFGSKKSVTGNMSAAEGYLEVSSASELRYRGKDTSEQCEDTTPDTKRRLHSTEGSFECIRFLSALLCSLTATLCKESGITALCVIAVYSGVRFLKTSKINQVSIIQSFFINLSLIGLWGFFVIWFRLWMMDWTNPVFAEPDNKAAFSREFLTRCLTYSWLCVLNFWLLLCPITLSYDWSYDTVPLVLSILDGRNLLSLLFFMLLIGGGFTALVKNRSCPALIMGYVLMVAPFVPASNLFFPVGFVIAERVLYLPSGGFTVLIALAGRTAKERLPMARKWINFFLFSIMVLYGVRTIARNQVWRSKEVFLRSGVKTFPQNAKMHYNWGNYLNEINRKSEAAAAYEMALKLYPMYVGAMNNLATILETEPNAKNRVEELYRRVIQIQPTHFNAYHNLASHFIKQEEYDKAQRVLVRAIQVVGADVTLAGNLALALKLHNKLDQAERVYQHLLGEACSQDFSDATPSSCLDRNASILAEYAQLLEKKGEYGKALVFYKRSEKIEPSNERTLILHANNLLNLHQYEKAAEIIIRAGRMTKGNAHHVWALASKTFTQKRYAVSLKLYEEVISLLPHNLEVRGQYAAALFETGQLHAAQNLLVNITQMDVKCRFDETRRNLATLYARQGKFEKAIRVLESCIKLIESQSNQTEDDNVRCANVRLQLARHEKLEAYRRKESGDLHSARYLWSDAIKNLEKAIQLHPDFDAAKDELKKTRKP